MNAKEKLKGKIFFQSIFSGHVARSLYVGMLYVFMAILDLDLYLHIYPSFGGKTEEEGGNLDSVDDLVRNWRVRINKS